MIWAVVYFGVTLGGPASATIGMRVMDLEMRTWYGAPAYFVLGAVHAIAFWFTVSFFTPFVLLVAFFNERRRLLHDILARDRDHQQSAARLYVAAIHTARPGRVKGFDEKHPTRNANTNMTDMTA